MGFISCGVRMWPDQKPTDANSRLTKVSRDRGLAGRGGEVEVGRSDPFRPLQEAPLHPWPKAALCKPTRPRVPRPGGRSGLAALLPPRRTRRPRDRPWRLGWAWGSVRAPRRSSPWRVHPRSHSLHCTCWWLLGPGPLEGRSPTKQFPLLPSPPCFGGSFPSSPGEHKSGGSALASVVSFCSRGSGPAFQPWWQLLFSVVVPGPSPRPRWPSACAGGRPEATLLPRRRPPGPSWLLAPTPAPSLSLLSWIRF